MHQARVNVFCPSLTFSPDNCTVLFWPCGLQISLEPQSCKRLHMSNNCPVLPRYERPSLPRFECWRPLIHFLLCFFHLFAVQSNGKTTPVSKCHEELEAACHESGFHGAVWAVFFNLQCHGTQMREETPRNALLVLYGSRIFQAPSNQC